MSEMVWEEPPPYDGRGRSNRKSEQGLAFAEALRSKPGEWARWPNQVGASHAGSVRTGKLVAFRPAGAYEARWKGLQSQPGTIWIRYVGEHQEYADDALVWVDADSMTTSIRRSAYRHHWAKFTSRGSKGDGSFREWCRVTMWFVAMHGLTPVEEPPERYLTGQ